MSDLKTRSYTTEDGRRTTLRFDAATWRAIEIVAARKALLWTQWVHMVPSVYENRHTDVRVAVVEGLLDQQPLFVRAGASEAMDDSPLLIDSKTMNDEQLASDLKAQFNFTESGPLDYGGFVLYAGSRQGRPCIWIQNGLRGMPHIAIPIPSWIGQTSTVELETGNSK